jgi:hypothetical protein
MADTAQSPWTTRASRTVVQRADHHWFGGHQGLTCCYYLHVPLEETLRRHVTKPQAAEYGRAQMSDWYRDLDLLPGAAEHVIPAEMSLDETVHRIMTDTGLTTDAAVQRSSRQGGSA